MLFGKFYTFDHSGYYETCARVRSYEENMSPKNYCLEHTKPIFNERKILTVYNVYVQQTFVEMFKIFKSHTPVSIYTLFSFSVRDTNFHVYLPKVRLDISKNNYVFKFCSSDDDETSVMLSAEAVSEEQLSIGYFFFRTANCYVASFSSPSTCASPIETKISV